MSAGGETSMPRRRSGLFAKYVGGMIAVVTLVLVVNGAIDVWFSYVSTRESLERIQEEKAASAAQRVEQFVIGIEGQIGWTTHAQWAAGPVDQRRFDFIRLLRQVPAITELVQVDGNGKEQLKVSRLAMDVVGSQADWSQDARFKEIQDKKVWFSAVYLRKESEPYMSVSLGRAGRRSGATVAEVNLKLIWDVVNAIKVGTAGYAYVVDRDGKLIAHPDISLVLRATDMSRLEHVRTVVVAEARRRDEEAARRAAALEAARQRGNEAEVRRLMEEEARGAAAQLRSTELLPTGIGSNLIAKDVLYAAAPIPALGWLVFVELPMQEALQPLYTSLIQTGLLLLLGLALAAGAAWVLARRMMVPIRALGAGAARLGGGDLGHRIEVKSGDEIETLAGGFNRMAEQLQESYAGLEQKVEARTHELARSVEELTASGEILRMIAGSPDDLQPMFQTILENAIRLCEASFGALWLLEAGMLRTGAMREVPPDLAVFLQQRQFAPGGTILAKVIDSLAPEQVLDARADQAYVAGDALRRATVDLGGIRTLLAVPLLRQGELIGILALCRQEVRAFAEKQINLVATFADQAVIAIENSRLLRELRTRTQELGRSVEELTASGEILRLIASTPDDLQPMFDTIMEHATRLCEASFCTLWMYEGDMARAVAVRGAPPAYEAHLLKGPIRPPDHTALAQVRIKRAPIQQEDVRATPGYATGDPVRRAGVDLGGIRTLLSVPLIRQGEAIGVLAVYRREVQLFTEKQIKLVATFADQAVIAIENSRLLRELRSRTQELARSVDELTASGEILRIIAGSPDDLQPMFQTILEHADNLCEASFGILWMVDGDVVRPVAYRGLPAAYAAHLQHGGPVRPGPHTIIGRVIATGAPVQIEDTRADEAYTEGDPVRVASVDLGGIRTNVGVPMIRQGEVIGVLCVFRQEVRLFSDKQVNLLATFADQAVIAIENSRLLRELRSRTQELSRSVEELTASGEILRLIAASPDDLRPMFQSILEHGTRLCEANFGVLRMIEGDVARPVAMHNIPPALATYLEQDMRPGPDTVIGRAMRSLVPTQIENAHTSEAYLAGDPMRRAFVDLGGMRSVLSVPMIRQGELIGALSIYRREGGKFTDKQISLMSTFADQAVIAIENSRLLRELRSRTEELGESLEYQTATSDVLKVISGSAFNLVPVLQTVAETAANLCHADEAALFLREGDAYRWAASVHINSAYINAVRDEAFTPGRDSLIGRTALEGTVVQIEDALADPEYGRKDLARLGGVRTLLGVPLVRDGAMTGVMVLTRRRVEAFTDKQVEVLQVFADQAVIAVENVRLFTEIQDKSRQLELASQHKSQFLANMSHELRTPLNAVLGYAELLLDGIYGELPARARGVLDRVQSNGKHLLGLINDVLDLSKIEAGQLKLSLDAYALTGVVQTVVAATESLANAKGLKLTATIAEGLPTGVGDERRLAQVLLNLVGNAIKFTDKGGVEITARAQGGSFDIAVSDTGTGIAPEDQARIFEEFQQVDNTSTRKKGGTGLGLAISRRIVALHGGALSVESEPGRGSTFRVILPVKVESQREAA